MRATRFRFLAVGVSAAALLLGPATPANAAVPSGFVTGTVPMTDTDWLESVTIAKFDPTLGTLVGVTCKVEGSAVGDARLENLSTSSGASTTVHLEVVHTLYKPDLSGPIVVVVPLIDDTVVLPTFDGSIDFAGSSGTTYDPVTGVAADDATMTAPADLALFVAASPGDTITLPLRAVGASSLQGGGNVIGGVTSRAGATAGCAYLYEPVPEPVVPEFPLPVVASAVATATGALVWARTRRAGRTHLR